MIDDGYARICAAFERRPLGDVHWGPAMVVGSTGALSVTSSYAKVSVLTTASCAGAVPTVSSFSLADKRSVSGSPSVSTSS